VIIHNHEFIHDNLSAPDPANPFNTVEARLVVQGYLRRLEAAPAETEFEEEPTFWSNINQISPMKYNDGWKWIIEEVKKGKAVQEVLDIAGGWWCEYPLTLKLLVATPLTLDIQCRESRSVRLPMHRKSSTWVWTAIQMPLVQKEKAAARRTMTMVRLSWISEDISFTAMDLKASMTWTRRGTKTVRTTFGTLKVRPMLLNVHISCVIHQITSRRSRQRP
jgi:hypothetical protein